MKCWKSDTTAFTPTDIHCCYLVKRCQRVTTPLAYIKNRCLNYPDLDEQSNSWNLLIQLEVPEMRKITLIRLCLSLSEIVQGPLVVTCSQQASNLLKTHQKLKLSLVHLVCLIYH